MLFKVVFTVSSKPSNSWHLNNLNEYRKGVGRKVLNELKANSGESQELIKYLVNDENTLRLKLIYN